MGIINAVREAFQTNSRATPHINWELDHLKKPINIIGGVGAVITGMIMLPHAPVLLILAGGAVGGPFALKYGLKALSHVGAMATGFVKGLVSDGSEPAGMSPKEEPKIPVPENTLKAAKIPKQKLQQNFRAVAPRQEVAPQKPAQQLNVDKRFNPAGPMKWNG